MIADFSLVVRVARPFQGCGAIDVVKTFTERGGTMSTSSCTNAPECAPRKDSDVVITNELTTSYAAQSGSVPAAQLSAQSSPNSIRLGGEGVPTLDRTGIQLGTTLVAALVYRYAKYRVEASLKPDICRPSEARPH